MPVGLGKVRRGQEGGGGHGHTDAWTHRHTATQGGLGSMLPSWQLPSGWLITACYRVLWELEVLVSNNNNNDNSQD